MTTAQVVFHVTFVNPTSTATQLTGSTDAGSGYNLTTLTLRTTGSSNRLIKKSATVASILVSQAEFNSIPNPTPPTLHWDLTLTVDDPGTGTVTVQSMAVTLPPHLAHFQSDVHELSPSATADEQSSHDLSTHIIGELRKLNHRVDSIEKLLLEAREASGGLRPTGSDPR